MQASSPIDTAKQLTQSKAGCSQLSGWTPSNQQKDLQRKMQLSSEEEGIFLPRCCLWHELRLSHEQFLEINLLIYINIASVSLENPGGYTWTQDWVQRDAYVASSSHLQLLFRSKSGGWCLCLEDHLPILRCLQMVSSHSVQHSHQPSSSLNQLPVPVSQTRLPALYPSYVPDFRVEQPDPIFPDPECMRLISISILFFFKCDWCLFYCSEQMMFFVDERN